jgi:serine/threonine-protein kinase
MLSPGDRVRDYEVVAPLRAGGMGTLYLARRRGIGGFARLVALKVVHSQLPGHQSVRQSLLAEARISAQINHPNVVQVEEAGSAGDLCFIAMEYVHGISLAELLEELAERRQRMNPKLCVWLAAQMAEGLRAIHAATGEDGTPLHIVHRDVSPQNMLVSRTGHIKLIDFGIADSQQTQPYHGRRRAMLGKLGYMAPEQLRLELVDRRCDIYALGVVLWEMLTCRRFLRCERVDDERDWALRRSPPPPSQYGARVTPALDAVVLKALAFEPSARYQGALALRTALLSAVPLASRIDAPTLEAALRALLENRLERLGTAWPSGVHTAPELDGADDSDEETSVVPAPRLRDLASAMQSGSRRSLHTEDEAQKTLGATPSALRAAHGVARADGASEPPPLPREPPPLPRETPHARGLLASALGQASVLGLPVLCLLLGTLIGSLAVRQRRSAWPWSEPRTPPRAQPAAQRADSVLPPSTAADAGGGYAPRAAGRKPAPEVRAAH